MNRKIKYHKNGNKKKEIINILKNNNKFKLILNYDEQEKITNLMEKPNFKLMNSHIFLSGAHIFTNPIHNHVDFFDGKELIYKEYPEIRGSTNYGYNFSGGVLLI